MEHRLHFLTEARPIKQKRRYFGHEKDQVIKKKVKEFLEAKHIKEVQFSISFSNVVLVKKSSRK